MGITHVNVGGSVFAFMSRRQKRYTNLTFSAYCTGGCAFVQNVVINDPVCTIKTAYMPHAHRYADILYNKCATKQHPTKHTPTKQQTLTPGRRIYYPAFGYLCQDIVHVPPSYETKHTKTKNLFSRLKRKREGYIYIYIYINTHTGW